MKAQTGGFGFLGTTLFYDWFNFLKRIDQLGKKNAGNNLLALPESSNVSGLKVQVWATKCPPLSQYFTHTLILHNYEGFF
jgi:hypothetical protein